ncbi:hypothetical protein GBAR_LOCUS3676, partial [Geodia barretti]
MGGKWGHESPYLPTDLVLTGHTDGSVRLWYCSSVIFQPFFTLPTTPFFKYNYTLSPSTPTRRPPQRNAEDLLPLPPPLPNHPRPSLPSTTQRRHTEESERLKTPSPATGQLRVEGEEVTDGQSPKAEPSVSPGPSRKTIFSREKKSIFKRPSKSRFS